MSPSGWRDKTPAVVRDGFFILPPAMPVWQMFCRLSRGRNYTMHGAPLPLAYADVWNASERCKCELPADVLESLFIELDDILLSLAAKTNEHNQHSGGDKQPGSGNGGGAI